MISKKVDHTVHFYYCTTLPIIRTHPIIGTVFLKYKHHTISKKVDHTVHFYYFTALPFIRTVLIFLGTFEFSIMHTMQSKNPGL